MGDDGVLGGEIGVLFIFLLSPLGPGRFRLNFSKSVDEVPVAEEEDWDFGSSN